MIASRRSLAPLGLAALALPALAAQAVSPAWAQAQDRAVVDAFYTRLLSAGGPPDLAERAARILAPNWQSIGDYSGKPKTREQFVAQLQGFGKLIPNMKFAAEEVLAMGNRFVARSRATGTPTGPLFGAPVGKSFDIMAVDIHTVENGLITVSYHVEDWATAIRQLNAK
jgi:predicted ester cyclase